MHANIVSNEFLNDQNWNTLCTLNSLKSFTVVILLHVAFAISLFGNEIWYTLVFISFLNGLVYSYESIAICFSFPNASHGIIFALVYLVGSLFAFVQIPIIDQGKDTNHFRRLLKKKLHFRIIFNRIDLYLCFMSKKKETLLHSNISNLVSHCVHCSQSLLFIR